MGSSIWTYRQGTGYQPGVNLAGFEGEATDGRIGKVDKRKDEIKNAPEFDRDRHDEDFEYQQQIGSYYAPWPP